MIGTSTTAADRYTPPHLEGKPGAPVFLLRSGSIIERGQMEAELSGQHQAGRVFGYELRDAVREGVMALLVGDPALDELLGFIDAEAEGNADALADDAKRALVEVRQILAEHWAPYRDLVTQLERRREIAPIVALRRFCVGWENVDATFSRGRDGMVEEACLRGIDLFMIRFAGNRAYALQYAEGQEGNSPRPSQSDAGQRTSSADGSSKGAGRSPAKRGRKTRAPRSPRGSGQS
jgi:hypothetical protein